MIYIGITKKRPGRLFRAFSCICNRYYPKRLSPNRNSFSRDGRISITLLLACEGAQGTTRFHDPAGRNATVALIR